MAIRKISTFQDNEWTTRDIGVDSQNISVTGASVRDLVSVDENENQEGVIGYDHAIDINNLVGLTANVQEQINKLLANSGSGGKQKNVITLSTDTVELTAENLYQDIVITQSGDSEIVVFVQDSDVASIELVDKDTYRVSAISPVGKTNIIVIMPDTDEYSGDIKIIGVEINLVSDVLEDNSWADISAVSSTGLGESIWNVGDKKKIVLNGSFGALSNYETYLFILGFNHNSQLEGQGISFGGFKTASGVNVCLCDDYYNNYNISGSKYFNMNHQRGSSQYGHNYGGWKGCDMRYDILGSTNVQPSSYTTGSTTQTTSRVGYDATEACITSPITNTLMAALPNQLRNILKPITKYTDNVGNSSTVQANVTSSIDYLPLLAEYQVFGARTYANSYEQNKQKQYQYYKNGNSKIKYRNSTSVAALWWCRSASDVDTFCAVGSGGTAYASYSRNSFGISVVLLV